MRTQTILLAVGVLGFAAWRLRRASSDELEEIVVTAKRIEPGTADASAWDRALEFIDVTATRITETVRRALPRGYRNNNPGNIRYLARNAWNGQVANDAGYGIYESPQMGTRALGRQLLKYAATGANTVRAIITRWAPPTENVTSAYVAAVAKALGVAADARIDVNARLGELARAIAKHENGYVDPTYDFERWVRL